MNRLGISKDLALPLDAVTQTQVVYGGKGMGKTNFGSVFVEELSKARLRFSVVTPLDVWWGLQHGRNKSQRGIDVLLLGGRRADIPIEPTSGSVVADLVADESVSTVVTLCDSSGVPWGVGERTRFMADYCLRLFRRQGEKKIPLHQVIDEAGRFVPQQIPHGAVDLARCVGAIEQIVEWGRNVGVGVTLITQRSARMNKSVSELSECMIAFRTVGARSIEAVLDWLGAHIDKSQWKEFVEQLRKLPTGTALVVSPGWLEFEGIVPMRARETFDSSATPKVGKSLRAPGKAAKPDLAKYRERMKATIERVSSDDPKALRRRVAELERKLAAQRPLALAVNQKTIEVPVLKDKQITRLENTLGRLLKLTNEGMAHGKRLAQAWGTINEVADTLVKALRSVTNYTDRGRASALVPRTVHPGSRTGSADSPSSAVRSGDGNGAVPVALGKGDCAVLTAIAQHAAGVTRGQITVLTGYKRSTRDRYLQRLAAGSHISFAGNLITATAQGYAALGTNFELLPTGAALREHWVRELPEGERKLFVKICEAYPDPVEREALDVYKRSTRDRYLQLLQARQLVHAVGRGAVIASETLFDVDHGRTN